MGVLEALLFSFRFLMILLMFALKELKFVDDISYASRRRRGENLITASHEQESFTERGK